MNSLYTIQDVYRIPLPEIISYVKAHYPPTTHFYATETQLRYLAIYFLDRDGLLTAHDSRIFREPYFGQLYAVSGGDPFSAVSHMLFNFIPGVDYLGLL